MDKDRERGKTQQLNFLKRFRKEKGLTQKQFSAITEIPIYRISRMENNGRVSLEDACGLCNVFPEEWEIKKLRLCRKEAENGSL